LCPALGGGDGFESESFWEKSITKSSADDGPRAELSNDPIRARRPGAADIDNSTDVCGARRDPTEI
jgi:hypothetical protein